MSWNREISSALPLAIAVFAFVVLVNVPGFAQTETDEDRSSLNAAQWVQVQMGLVELGLNPGPVDGIPGPRTRAAIMAFQSANGLEATGFVDLTLVAKIIEGGVTPVACPDWELPPTFGEIELREDFPNDPYREDVIAGGETALADCFAAEYVGYVASAPDFDLYYRTSGTSELSIMVRASPADTLLLVSDPSGEWYIDDDSGGDLDPKLVFSNASDGLYSIWIATYGSDNANGTLIITDK